MFERYVRAYNNDLAYIQKLLANNPEVIDDNWDGTGNDPDWWKRTAKDGALLGGLGAPLIGGVLVLSAPVSLAISATYVLASIAGIVLHDKIDNPFPASLREPPSRKDYALLEYAAAGGATDVAVYLILQGAETSNNFFMEVAKVWGYGETSFIPMCAHAIEVRARYQSKINDLSLENLQLCFELQDLYDQLGFPASSSVQDDDAVFDVLEDNSNPNESKDEYDWNAVLDEEKEKEISVKRQGFFAHSPKSSPISESKKHFGLK